MTLLYPRSGIRLKAALGEEEAALEDEEEAALEDEEEAALEEKQFAVIKEEFRRSLNEAQRIQLFEFWTECLPQFGLCSGAPKHGEVAPVLGRLGTRSKRLRNALQSILKEGVSKRRFDPVTCWSQHLRDEMQALVSRRAGKKNVTGDGVRDQLHTSGLEPEIFDRVLLAVHLLASAPNFEQGSVVETVSDLDLLHGCATQARKRLGKGKGGRESEEPLNFLIWRLADFYAGHYGRPTAHWAKGEGRKSPFVRLVHGVHKLLPPKARAKSDKALGERIDEVLKLWGRPRPQDKKFEFLA